MKFFEDAKATSICAVHVCMVLAGQSYRSKELLVLFNRLMNNVTVDVWGQGRLCSWVGGDGHGRALARARVIIAVVHILITIQIDNRSNTHTNNNTKHTIDTNVINVNNTINNTTATDNTNDNNDYK